MRARADRLFLRVTPLKGLRLPAPGAALLFMPALGPVPRWARFLGGSSTSQSSSSSARAVADPCCLGPLPAGDLPSSAGPEEAVALRTTRLRAPGGGPGGCWAGVWAPTWGSAAGSVGPGCAEEA